MIECKKNIGLETCKIAGCKYYTPDFPVGFDVVQREKGDEFVYQERDSRLLFVLGGEISLSFNEYRNCVIKANEMFFLTGLIRFDGVILSAAKFIIFKSNNVSFPCTDEVTGRLFKKKQGFVFEPQGIPIKEEIRLWLDQVIHYSQAGLSCYHIMVIKKQELSLLLRNILTDEENIRLFYLSLHANQSFRQAVLLNYMDVKTAEELASFLGYGIKTFRKLFKENFGETPFKWMQKQTQFQVKGLLMEKNIPLKEIMFKYKFTSSSHFSHYCQKYFGATPTQIRNGEIGK